MVVRTKLHQLGQGIDCLLAQSTDSVHRHETFNYVRSVVPSNGSWSDGGSSSCRTERGEIANTSIIIRGPCPNYKTFVLKYLRNVLVILQSMIRQVII